MNKLANTFAAALLLAAGSAAAADKSPPAVTIPRLSMEVGLALAQATLEACRKETYNIAVTVVDRGGHPQVVLRDTLAMDLTLRISRLKAYTAMSFNAPTSQLETRLPKIDGIIAGGGGLPIVAGGKILGGVGVSGGPTGAADEKCALAGMEAVRFELEGI